MAPHVDIFALVGDMFYRHKLQAHGGGTTAGDDQVSARNNRVCGVLS